MSSTVGSPTGSGSRTKADGGRASASRHSWTSGVHRAEAGRTRTQALSSGSLDVYVAGLAPLLVARSKGIDVRVVAATVVEEMGFSAGAAFAPFFDGRTPAQAAVLGNATAAQVVGGVGTDHGDFDLTLVDEFAAQTPTR